VKRIFAPLLIATVTAALLVGCGTASGSSDLDPIDLSVEANITALCGDEAESVGELVASAMKTTSPSGKRNALKDWGIDDPSDDEVLADIHDALTERAEVECDNPDADPTPEPSDCPAEFRQVPATHENNRVVDDFKDKVETALAESPDFDESMTALLLEQAGEDALVLAVWTHAFGLYEDPNAWESLIKGDCLSSDGQKLFYQFQGALTAKGTTVEAGDAPSNGYNSGVDGDGTFGVNDNQGVHGDRTAIKVTLPDGTVVWILVRCGNVVYPEPPGNLPKVPTDDPYPEGNADVGGGPNADPGADDYIAPDDMDHNPKPDRTDPTAPTEPGEVEADPVDVGSGGDSTVDTGDQTNDGDVDSSGGNGCNPIVMSC
jgi:hypothetical protein